MNRKLFTYNIGVFLFVVIFVISAHAHQKFVANLSGLQTVPSNASNGKGVCEFSFNETQLQMMMNCNYRNLSGNRTALQVGVADVGENGFALFSVNLAGGQSGGLSANFGISAQDVARLRSNQLYVALLSENFPNGSGEIRGQIKLANGTYNDYDGDGRTDLTVYRNSNNTFYARSSLTENLIARQIGSAGDSVSLTVDFDGDGLSDFSTARYASQIVWRIFKSETNTLEETPWGSSSLGDFFAAADYDGDGASDIAVFRAGVWYIIESSTGNFRNEFWGQSGDVPAANDFDKDGKADLTIARNENGTRVWHIRRSSDGVSYAIQWGLSSDAYFTGRADFDGDGANDILVIRTESGQRVFYIYRSSDGALQTIRWGASSDLVKLGDYDGDGKTDAAVTRTIDGQKVFLILNSSTNQLRYAYFGLPSDF